jgi:hypothetical protein
VTNTFFPEASANPTKKKSISENKNLIAFSIVKNIINLYFNNITNYCLFP